MKKMMLLCAFMSSVLSAATEEIDLNLYETSFYSQNGEDGIIAKILQTVGTSSKFCIELGAYDGVKGSNTYLLRKQGWNSLLVDRMFENPEHHLHKAFITAENITDLFDHYDIPLDSDLLSIDIEYNNFYVWKKLDNKYQPKLVVIAYNSTIPPEQDQVVVYKPYFCGDGTAYYGASILAMYNLGRAKGYSLVYADAAGVNLFFVRDDILAEKEIHFKDMNDVEKLYRAPTAKHTADTRQRIYVSSQEVL